MERNLALLLRHQADRFGPRPALRHKRFGLYQDVTWTDYLHQVESAAAALIEAGVQPGDRVGLLAENRVEWLLADMAILSAAAVNVPPHAPLTARQVHFQLDDAEVSWLFVSNRTQLDKVLQIRADLPHLRGIVVFDRAAAGPEARSWSGFVQHGRQRLANLADELRRRVDTLAPDDLATIMYTSGTTGNPKGVMLTHGNLLSNTESTLSVSPHGPEDVVLSWLPYSHIYARTVEHYGGLFSGVLTCLAESADTVIANLKEIQPTNMASVPRFYEKVLGAVASPDPEQVKRRLRSIFGPRVDWLSSGGAPLPLAVAKAFHDAGIIVLQGYGLTESSPVISFNSKTAYKLDTVGRPVPGVEVRIAADGEVLTRGPHVMKGYWKNPQATADALRDGWLHTGDLGQLDVDGFLKITGRKKELLVLSNGKKIVPSYLEGLLQSDPCIDQAVVSGEGRNFLTALVVPNWDNIRMALEAEGITGVPDGEEGAQHPAVRHLLQRRIEQRLADVSGPEQVRKFVILPQPFSVATEELTVSLKLRRNVVLERYRKDLDELYHD